MLLTFKKSSYNLYIKFWSKYKMVQPTIQYNAIQPIMSLHKIWSRQYGSAYIAF